MPNNDLISRKALIEQIEEDAQSMMFTSHHSRMFHDDMVEFAINAIKCAPAVDAEPVIHAKWIYDDLGNTHCSNCKRRIPFITECDTDDDCGGAYDVEIEETDHCPNCGAKMENPT